MAQGPATETVPAKWAPASAACQAQLDASSRTQPLAAPGKNRSRQRLVAPGSGQAKQGVVPRKAVVQT